MYVYIVYQSIDYEGGTVDAVFSTEEKAIDYCKVHPDHYYPIQYKKVKLDQPFDIQIG